MMCEFFIPYYKSQVFHDTYELTRTTVDTEKSLMIACKCNDCWQRVFNAHSMHVCIRIGSFINNVWILNPYPLPSGLK